MEYDTWLIYLLKRNKRRSYHDLGYITQKNSLNGTCTPLNDPTNVVFQ